MVGRRKDAVNYKNDVLIRVIGEILPNGEYGWQAVALAYQEETKEETARDTTDLKKHWIQKLCNNMKKPTGRTGENNDCIHRCILIEKKIMTKTHSGILGLSSDSDALPSENKDSGGEESEGGGIMGDDLFREDLENVDDATTAVPVPSPLRRSPRQFPPPCPTDAGEVPVQLVDVDEVPPPLPATAAAARPPPTNQNNESVTPLPPNQVRNALAKAGNVIKSSKTKNSSNKPKERTSIAGAIVKLIELQHTRPTSSTGAAGGGAAMTMTLMRQIERINKSMDERDRRDAKERRKERKRRKKRRAKKKAKKKKKKAKRAALESLDDHGGKEGGGEQQSSSDSSESERDSDSSSSSDSNSSDESSNYGRGSWRGGGGTMPGGVGTINE